MTDTETGTPTPDEHIEPTAPGEPGEPATEENSDGNDGTADIEARKYRKRAQAAEAERDSIGAMLEAMQRQHIELTVTAAGLKPAAVWATAELADLLDETGTVNADAVQQAVTAARDQLGIAHGLYVPAEGHQPAEQTQTGDFTTAFAPHNRR